MTNNGAGTYGGKAILHHHVTASLSLHRQHCHHCCPVVAAARSWRVSLPVPVAATAMTIPSPLTPPCFPHSLTTTTLLSPPEGLSQGPKYSKHHLGGRILKHPGCNNDALVICCTQVISRIRLRGGSGEFKIVLVLFLPVSRQKKLPTEYVDGFQFCSTQDMYGIHKNMFRPIYLLSIQPKSIKQMTIIPIFVYSAGKVEERWMGTEEWWSWWWQGQGGENEIRVVPWRWQ
ncbi:hypothetical protein K439DRAFT_1623083 [Ramaria rubella]|nr:hypothetical protein K439DRAFT_1623083 [Ramaria rubella]